MSVINNIDVTVNLSININQGGVSDGTAHQPGRFLANAGTLMLRCVPLVVLTMFGIQPPAGSNHTWRHK